MTERIGKIERVLVCKGQAMAAPRERRRSWQGEKEQRKRTRAHGGCLWLSEAKKDVISCEKPR